MQATETSLSMELYEHYGCMKVPKNLWNDTLEQDKEARVYNFKTDGIVTFNKPGNT